MGGGSNGETDDDGGAGGQFGTDRSVPDDATWELVVQSPVERSRPDGLTTAIVAAVAEAEGVSPREVTSPPLYDVVDAAALEAAFFGSDEEAPAPDETASTEFMYRGHRVVVRSDGWVLVFERRDE